MLLIRRKQVHLIEQAVIVAYFKAFDFLNTPEIT